MGEASSDGPDNRALECHGQLGQLCVLTFKQQPMKPCGKASLQPATLQVAFLVAMTKNAQQKQSEDGRMCLAEDLKRCTSAVLGMALVCEQEAVDRMLSAVQEAEGNWFRCSARFYFCSLCYSV